MKNLIYVLSIGMLLFLVGCSGEGTATAASPTGGSACSIGTICESEEISIRFDRDYLWVSGIFQIVDPDSDAITSLSVTVSKQKYGAEEYKDIVEYEEPSFPTESIDLNKIHMKMKLTDNPALKEYGCGDYRFNFYMEARSIVMMVHFEYFTIPDSYCED